MELLLICFFCSNLINSLILLFIYLNFRKTFAEPEIPSAVPYETPFSSDVEFPLSPPNEEFKQRIARLKDEIAAESIVVRKGSVADELHPAVHNLPHNSVNTYSTISDVEVSE